MLSIAAVQQKYGVKVSDDVAEAILIGRYGSMAHQAEVKMAFGKKKQNPEGFFFILCF